MCASDIDTAYATPAARVRRGLMLALLAGVLIGLPVLGPKPASAICTPPSADNVTATCTGATVNQNGVNGYGGGGEDNVSVLVVPGASVTGTFAGIFVGDNLRVLNNGTISGMTGVLANSIAALTNTGTISGGIGDGVVAGTIISLTNSGIISGGDDGVLAVTFGSLTNSGSISGIKGVRVLNTLTSLINNGVISGSGFGVTAGSLISLTNSGLISGATNAILETGSANTTLTLLPGSIVIGAIDLGGGVNTLNVGNGLSVSNTFVGGAPGVGGTGGQPFVVSGNQIAVADPSTLASHDDLVSVLTGGITSTVGNRLNGARWGGPGRAVAGAVSGQRLAFLPVPEDKSDPRWRWTAWVQGFGSWRHQEASGAAGDTFLSLGGAVAGMDRLFGGNGKRLFRAGLFLGGGAGTVGAASGRQATDMTTVFGGVYAESRFGPPGRQWVLSGTLTLGWLEYDRARTVANNLVASGLQTAAATYHGWSVSPEVTAVRTTMVFGVPFEPGMTLGYTALVLQGFREQGAADNMTVRGRTLHLLRGRLHLAVPVSFYTLGGQWRFVPKVAVEGRTQIGGRDVSGTLLGQAVSFDPGGERSVAAGVGGLALSYTRGALTLFVQGEGKYETDGSYQGTVRGGARIRF